MVVRLTNHFAVAEDLLLAKTRRGDVE